MRLEMLHQLFHPGSSNLPAGPEVLQCALDLISSDASLNAAASEEVLEMLGGLGAELRDGAQDERGGLPSRWPGGGVAGAAGSSGAVAALAARRIGRSAAPEGYDDYVVASSGRGRADRSVEDVYQVAQHTQGIMRARSL